MDNLSILNEARVLADMCLVGYVDMCPFSILIPSTSPSTLLFHPFSPLFTQFHHHISPQVCSDCHLRQRYLYSTDACVVCKVDNPKVIVPTPLDSSKEAYNDFEVWDNDMGSAYLYHDESNMFFPKAFFQKFVACLFEENCGKCGWKAKNSDAGAASGTSNNSNSSSSGEPTNFDQVRCQAKGWHTIHYTLYSTQ
jgi:hypothetical protein